VPNEKEDGEEMDSRFDSDDYDEEVEQDNNIIKGEENSC
jgi:hypothetical protein